MDCLRCYFLLFELAIQESNKACPIQISIGLPTICSFRCAQILETRYPSKQPVFSVVFPCPLFVVVFSRRKLPCGHVALVALCKRLAIPKHLDESGWAQTTDSSKSHQYGMWMPEKRGQLSFFGHCEDIKTKTSGHVSFHYIPHKILPKIKGIKFQ